MTSCWHSLTQYPSKKGSTLKGMKLSPFRLDTYRQWRQENTLERIASLASVTITIKSSDHCFSSHFVEQTDTLCGIDNRASAVGRNHSYLSKWLSWPCRDDRYGISSLWYLYWGIRCGGYVASFTVGTPVVHSICMMPKQLKPSDLYMNTTQFLHKVTTMNTTL